MMDTDKNAFLKEHGCCFYLSNDGKRLRVYTIVDFSFIRTFAPSF